MIRVRAVLLALLSAVLIGGAVPVAAAAQECTVRLECTAEDINLMSMPQRLDFVREMSAGPAAELLPSYAPRWRNIEGIIGFFRDHDMGSPGSWVSYVDAGIIEGIERGLAIALGRGTDTYGNPGSAQWAGYLTRLRDGQLTGRAAHDRAWSQAERPPPSTAYSWPNKSTA